LLGLIGTKLSITLVFYLIVSGYAGTHDHAGSYMTTGLSLQVENFRNCCRATALNQSPLPWEIPEAMEVLKESTLQWGTCYERGNFQVMIGLRTYNVPWTQWGPVSTPPSSICLAIWHLIRTWFFIMQLK
jgi:hypothetical protein